MKSDTVIKIEITKTENVWWSSQEKETETKIILKKIVEFGTEVIGKEKKNKVSAL